MLKNDLLYIKLLCTNDVILIDAIVEVLSIINF